MKVTIEDRKNKPIRLREADRRVVISYDIGEAFILELCRNTGIQRNMFTPMENKRIIIEC